MDLTKDSIAPLTTTCGFAGNRYGPPMAPACAYQPPGQLDDVYIKDIATGWIQPMLETPGITEHPVAWSNDARSLLAFTSGDVYGGRLLARASPRRSSATSDTRRPTARPRAIIPASSFA